MAQSIVKWIGKRRNKSSESSCDGQRASRDYKKSKKNSESSNNDTKLESSTDEIMTALDLTEGITEKLQLILAKVEKLDSIESSIRNIESTWGALELRIRKLEDFETTPTEDFAKLNKRCSDAEKQCKEKLEILKAKLAKHNSMIAKLEAKKQDIHTKMEELETKDLYLEAYSRSNISNTRGSVSSGYPNTEKRVENTTRSGVFLTKFEGV